MTVYIPDWRGVALRAVVAFGFGVVALTWPKLTISGLVLLFGIFVLLDGLMNVYSAIRDDPADPRRRGTVAVEGVAGVAVGIITLVWPHITGLALLWVIAAWAFITGVTGIVVAIGLRRELRHEWLLGVLGALSVIFAIVLVVAPVSGALAITWVIGWYAVLSGLLLAVVAWYVRKLELSAGADGAVPVT